MEEIKFRSAREEDCLFIWQLRNHPQTRINSINPGEISFETHKNWFNSKINNHNHKFLIFLKKEKKLGYIRIDIDSYIGYISIYVIPELRGKNLGKLILEKGCNYAFKILNLKKLSADVKETNKASLKIFKYCNFKIMKKNNDFIKLERDII